MKLEPIMQSEVSQKEKHQYSILTHILEKEMAIHSHILAWRILWTEGLGGLLSMGVTQSQTRLKQFSIAWNLKR